jgi:PAS domain S-box-containing protein
MSSARQTRVLLVSDRPGVRAEVSTTLDEEDGFAVETAACAAEGFEMLADVRPDCIVSEYELADTDGVAFLRAIRAEFPEVPFVLCATEGTETVASEAISAGVTEYVRQEETEQCDHLLERIRETVRENRQARRADRRSELRRLTRGLSDAGSFEIDTAADEIRMTEGARELTGFDDEADPSLEDVLALYPSDDRQEVRQALDRAVRTGQQTGGTWQYRSLDGQQRTAEFTFVPVETSTGTTLLRGILSDITEQRERRRELEQVETVFAYAQDPLFLVDVGEEFTIQRVNKAYGDATGLSGDAIEGKTPAAVLDERDATEVQAHYRACVERREPLEYDEQLQFGEDTTYWETRIAPVVIDGTVEYIAGSAHEVTERREREQKLSEQRRFIDQALDALDDLFYVLDPDGSISRWNERVPEVTGYTEADLTDKQAVEVFPDDERDVIASAIETVLTEGRATVEADILTADGERIPYEFTGARLTDTDGTTTGMVGIGRDLTERRERERRFQALVEESNDVITVVDDEGQIQYQSPTLRRILGYEPGEMTGDVAWAYIHPDDIEGVAAEFEAWITDPDTARTVTQFRVRHADGSWRWMEARATDLVGSSAVGGYVINSRDITDRKEQQKQLGLLDRVLRHNLRNDLNVILGTAETISLQATGEAASRAENIIDVCERLLHTAEQEREITDLLRETPEHSEVALGRLLERITATIASTYPDATLTVDCPETVTVRATNRFGAALHELITNAIVHNDSRSPAVTVSVTQTGETVGIEVADNGPLIPEMERDVLVEQGEQTPLYHGTGLGLWFVSLVVSRSGGTIAFAENDPTGNVVRVELPG